MKRDGLFDCSIEIISASACLLDADGRIIEVNQPWRDFAIANNTKDPRYGVGAFYHDCCALAELDPFARLAAEKLDLVTSGDVEQASFVYPCHGPTGKRWFRCLIVRRSINDEVLVVHFDVTPLMRAHEILGTPPDSTWVGHELAMDLQIPDRGYAARPAPSLRPEHSSGA